VEHQHTCEDHQSQVKISFTLFGWTEIHCVTAYAEQPEQFSLQPASQPTQIQIFKYKLQFK
jgi:hypothetical protein